MADVFCLSQNSHLPASPLILPFQLSPHSSTQLALPIKQNPGRRACSVGETAAAAFAFKQQKILSSFKLCKTAEVHPDILFLKVNFDQNKPMCKRLNVRVLPYFHFYRGADGKLESFSCSLAKFQKIKDAIETHNTARCSIGPPVGIGENLTGRPSPNVTDKPAGASPR